METLPNQERKHHPFSPSKLQYLEACPCWESRETVNARAIAGTLAHAIVETGNDDDKVSDSDAEAAAECLDFVAIRLRLFELEYQEANTPDDILSKFHPFTELKEVYLSVDDCAFHDCLATTAGYVDHVVLNWNQSRAEMFDWKFGIWPVEDADKNLQAIAYVLGLFKKYTTLVKIQFFFKQPHLDSLTEHTFFRSDIPALYLRVQAVVAQAREARRLSGDFSAAKPAVPACNFCANLGRCPKALDFALKVSEKFAPLSMPSDVTPSKVLDSENTKLALNLAAVMKVWAEAFRRQVTDRVIRRDAEIPEGYTLRVMDGRRSIVDMTRFREVALKHVSPEVYASALDASFGPIEEKISEQAPRGHKEATVKQFKQELLDAGAVKLGDSFAFLAVKPKTKNKT